MKKALIHQHYVAAADLCILSSVPLVLDWASPEQHYCYWPRVSPSHLPRLPLAEAALFHTSSPAVIGGEVSTFTPRTWPPLATGTTRHWSYTAHCTSSPPQAAGASYCSQCSYSISCRKRMG